MPEDLTQLVRDLSPSALAIFKRQLASLPERDRQQAFSRLANIPELSDIIGKATPIREVAQTQPKPTTQMDVPLWQKALSTVSAPFSWISEHVTEPFGAYATSPFTPAVAGTEGMGWAERERAEYAGWQEPTMTMPWGGKFRPTKGIVEMLPWLAVPSAGAVVGKAGIGAFRGAGLLGLAQREAGTQLGRSAALAAKMLKPVAAAEALPGKIVGRAVGKVLPKKIIPTEEAAKTVKPSYLSPDQIWRGLTKAERGELARTAGIERNVGWRSWATLTDPERQVISKQIATVREFPKGKIVSEMFPDGLPQNAEVAVGRLAGLFKSQRGLVKETQRIRKPERAGRISDKEMLEADYVKQGLSSEEAFSRSTAALKGELPAAELSEASKALITNLKQDIETLGRVVREAPYESGYDRLNAQGALFDMLNLKPLQRNQIAALEKVLGTDLAKELVAQLSFKTLAREWAVDLLNIPRALLSSFDLSGLLRQGGILTAGHPKVAINSVTPMMRDLLSDTWSVTYDSMLKNLEHASKLLNPELSRIYSKDAILYMAPVPMKVATMIAELEEAMMTKLLYKIPILGAGVKASNRAYVSVLNSMRMNISNNTVKTWEKMGLKYNPVEGYGLAFGEYRLGDIADLNRIINWASGRGTIPEWLLGGSKSGGWMNALFFSPRLIFSRLQFPTAILPSVTKSPLARREAMRLMLSSTGAGASILTMAGLSGLAKIELDPRSSDFGKMHVIGTETRLDIWTGYAQYIRFLAQLTTNKRVTQGGREVELNRLETMKRMLETKLSPAIGLFWDMAKGQTFMGEELPPTSAKSWAKQVYERAMPLAIQGMIDATVQDGLLGTAIGAFEIIGVGSITYTDEVRLARNKIAQKEYGMDWDEVGQVYGRAAQVRLEQTPTIIDAEREYEKRFATETPTLMQQWQNEEQGIEDTYREAVKFASNKVRKDQDWVAFRKAIDYANNYRRKSYSSKSKRKEYSSIIDYYNQPLNPDITAKMNPLDLARREYYQKMFAIDMFDKDTDEYDFDEAEKREQEFVVKYGQQALDYIEEYQGARWVDKPVEIQMLEEARELLRPYWQIADNVWAMYPVGLKDISDQIYIIERTNPILERRMLRQYPQILRARELIARYKAQMKQYNPAIKQAHRMFYG